MIEQDIELTNEFINFIAKLEIYQKKMISFYESLNQEVFEIYKIINTILFDCLSIKKRNVIETY